MEYIIIALLILIFGFGGAEILDKQEEKIENLCVDLLNEQTTLTDSLLVAQKYNECLWFNDKDENKDKQ